MADVVRHLSGVHRNIAALAGPSHIEGLEGIQDPVMEWKAASGRISSMLADQAIANQVVSSMIGELPFAQLVETMLCADTLVHTWDLAKGAGLDDRLDPDLVEATFAFMKPADEMLRHPELFGPKIEPPPGADAQSQLLCFLGREC